MAKHYDLRQRVAAWALLLVFVPLVVCSALHVHPEEAHAATTCEACLHHVHHAGHLSAASHAHECLLCQFLTLSFLPCAAIILPLLTPRCATGRAAWQAPLIRRCQTVSGCRAPPCALIFA